MSFPWNDETNARHAPSASGKRIGPRDGGCPWAQDDDANQFQRGAPSHRGKRTMKQDTQFSQPPMAAPSRPVNRNAGGGGGAPWASDDSGRFEKPTNAIGAGIGSNSAMERGMAYPPSYDEQDMYEQYAQQQQQQQRMYAQPLPDDDYMADENRSVQVPMQAAGSRAKPSGGGAPWAQDNHEPMMSASQAAYGGSQPGRSPSHRKNVGGASNEVFDAGAYAMATQQSRHAAKAVRDRMLGAGNVLTWG